MLGRASQIFSNTEKLLMVFSLSILCLLIVVEIMMRSFFQSGISWLEEFGRYVLVFGTFLGASIAIKRGDHPGMMAFLQALSPKPRQGIMAARDFLLGCFLLILDYYAWVQVLNLMKIGTRTSTLPLPLWVVYIILPVSILVMSIRCFISAKNHFHFLSGKRIEGKGE